jgi:hypothetical protein
MSNYFCYLENTFDMLKVHTEATKENLHKFITWSNNYCPVLIWGVGVSIWDYFFKKGIMPGLCIDWCIRPFVSLLKKTTFITYGLNLYMNQQLKYRKLQHDMATHQQYYIFFSKRVNNLGLYIGCCHVIFYSIFRKRWITMWYSLFKNQTSQPTSQLEMSLVIDIIEYLRQSIFIATLVSYWSTTRHKV